MDYEDKTGRYIKVFGISVIIIMLIYFFTPVPKLILSISLDAWKEFFTGMVWGLLIGITPLGIILLSDKIKKRKRDAEF